MFASAQTDVNERKRRRGLRNEISLIMETFSSIFLVVRKEDISQDLPSPFILCLLTDSLLFFKTIFSSNLSHFLPCKSYKVVSVSWRFCLEAIQDRIPPDTPREFDWRDGGEKMKAMMELTLLAEVFSFFFCNSNSRDRHAD
ncbi:hypothetical protein CSUI_007947 [Cystoisospora suis]|uniref:Uncharacterized protein n=1 Tax=Cystoisospora suis TaxID=483139 RepID=A0A2C6KPA7_9APIC|nr:hypothetical protein CSUI_007947 [Cystoisospora suis]